MNDSFKLKAIELILKHMLADIYYIIPLLWNSVTIGTLKFFAQVLYRIFKS